MSLRLLLTESRICPTMACIISRIDAVVTGRSSLDILLYYYFYYYYLEIKHLRFSWCVVEYIYNDGFYTWSYVGQQMYV